MNLFESPAQTLVNTVNTVGVMGKGIALEYKRRYPEMFERYAKFCKDKTLTVGKLYLYRTPNKWVLNFPTKRHWRSPSKPEYVEAGLKKFVASYAEYGITSISFPQLGTGNGGLDWEKVVRPMMEKYLENLPIPVYVHRVKNPADFVPEHKEKDLLQPRIRISFNEFFDDLREHAARVEPAPRAESTTVCDDGPPPLPVLVYSDDLAIPGEDFRSLWLDLKLRGALTVDEFPPDLARNAKKVVPLLCELGYIETAPFADPRNKKLNVRGIRFSPAAERDPEQTQQMPAHLEAVDQ